MQQSIILDLSLTHHLEGHRSHSFPLPQFLDSQPFASNKPDEDDDNHEPGHSFVDLHLGVVHLSHQELDRALLVRRVWRHSHCEGPEVPHRLQDDRLLVAALQEALFAMAASVTRASNSAERCVCVKVLNSDLINEESAR